MLRRCSGPCDCDRVHVVQERVATTPNVLLVHVERVGSDGTILRFPVQVEEEFNMPGLHALELSAAIYIEGSNLAAAHYVCVSRGPDGNFWNFDDQKPAFRLPSSLSALRQTSVVFVGLHAA